MAELQELRVLRLFVVALVRLLRQILEEMPHLPADRGALPELDEAGVATRPSGSRAEALEGGVTVQDKNRLGDGGLLVRADHLQVLVLGGLLGALLVRSARIFSSSAFGSRETEATPPGAVVLQGAVLCRRGDILCHQGDVLCHARSARQTAAQSEGFSS